MKMLHNITLTASGAHKYGQTALEYKHVFHLSRGELWCAVLCRVIILITVHELLSARRRPDEAIRGEHKRLC